MDKISLGKLGEDIAARYLAGKGYRPIARNWRPKKGPKGEVDLIMKHGSVLVFVEVKTIDAGEEYLPEDHLTPDKQRRLAKLAFNYINFELNNPEAEHRIDLVAITLDGAARKANIRHYPNAVSDTY